MKEEIKLYLEKYPNSIINLFNELRELIYSLNINIEEMLWAKLPSYYVSEKFIRLIPFKDHINIEASSIINYKDKLLDYKITPKGMLQIFTYQEIPVEILKIIFDETLRQ